MMDRKAFEESLLRPIPFWQDKTKDDVGRLLGDRAAQMVGFDQRNPHHCYDLFLHTLHTVDEIGSSFPVILRVAAFFHDVGKPAVAFEKQGRFVFYGHAKKSAELALPILKQLGYLPQEMDLILFYIRHHDDFISWALPSEKSDGRNAHLKEINRANVAEKIRKTSSADPVSNDENALVVWTSLIELCRADACAQAEFVFSGDKLIDSRAHKLQKIDLIKTEILNCLTT